MKLIKFGAEWCTHCKEQDTILEKFDAIPVEVIDCDNDTDDLCTKYRVMSIPTMLLIDNDQVVERFNGTITLDELNECVNNHIKKERPVL